MEAITRKLQPSLKQGKKKRVYKVRDRGTARVLPPPDAALGKEKPGNWLTNSFSG